MKKFRKGKRVKDKTEKEKKAKKRKSRKRKKRGKKQDGISLFLLFFSFRVKSRKKEEKS